jgi:ribonuclease HII
MLTLGIDEAARGPCIGSMFIAGAMFNEKDLDTLKKLGVKDSKLLIHKKRVELSKEIRKLAKGIKLIEIDCDEIDDAVDGNNELNLNWLEGIKSAEIINELKPDRVVIDCPSPNIEKYTNFIKSRLNKNVLNKIKLIVTHKADRDFIECGAASIIAKTERENHMDKLKKKYGNIGPGYTSNEITQKFIKENFDKHPEIFRKSWSTFKNAKIRKEQKSLGDY